VSTTTTVLAASDTFAGPLPGAGRPAFSYLLLGGLRGWADGNADHVVDADEALAFARGALQTLFKSDERLPSLRGPKVQLAANTREDRPDLAALVAGRCPRDTRWDGRGCRATPAVKCPPGTTWDGSACVGACPPGSAWDGADCVGGTVVCPPGATWTGTACAAGPRNSPGRRAGDTRRDAKTGLVWVWMPPGTFAYGCEPDDAFCDDDERPDRAEQVAGFWLMQTEVTDDAWRACEQAGGCKARRCTAGELGSGREPAVCVDHAQAGAFCAWVDGRLPTAVEWEYGAKSGQARIYPWGEGRPDATRANCRGCGDRFDRLAPVASFPQGATPWGLHDMAGNVWEATSSRVDPNRVEIRGGSWYRTPPSLRASERDRDDPRRSDDGLGFRCAQ
jgi:formylglycine-generating enzyme required for sulfatase activity